MTKCICGGLVMTNINEKRDEKMFQVQLMFEFQLVFKFSLFLHNGVMILV